MFADELPLTEESELEVMGVFEEWKCGNGIERINSQYREHKVNGNWKRVETQSPIRKMTMWLLW